MTWTQEDEQDFMDMVERRRKLGIPFNPFGRGHEPPTDAELASTVPMATRLQWAVDLVIKKACSQPDQHEEDSTED